MYISSIIFDYEKFRIFGDFKEGSSFEKETKNYLELLSVSSTNDEELEEIRILSTFTIENISKINMDLNLFCLQDLNLKIYPSLFFDIYSDNSVDNTDYIKISLLSIEGEIINSYTDNSDIDDIIWKNIEKSIKTNDKIRKINIIENINSPQAHINIPSFFVKLISEKNINVNIKCSNK